MKFAVNVLRFIVYGYIIVQLSRLGHNGVRVVVDGKARTFQILQNVDQR